MFAHFSSAFLPTRSSLSLLPRSLSVLFHLPFLQPRRGSFPPPVPSSSSFLSVPWHDFLTLLTRSLIHVTQRPLFPSLFLSLVMTCLLFFLSWSYFYIFILFTLSSYVVVIVFSPCFSLLFWYFRMSFVFKDFIKWCFISHLVVFVSLINSGTVHLTVFPSYNDLHSFKRGVSTHLGN